MKIVVNEQELDVTYENEKTVGDVVNELKQWLADSGMSITRCSLDDNDVADGSRESWATTPIEQIETLTVEAVLPAERDPNSLVTLVEYFELLKRNLESGDTSALRDVLGEFGYLSQSINRVLRVTGVSPDTLVPVRSLRESIDQGSGQDFDTLKSEALHATGAVLSALQSRLSEIIRPEKELGITASLLAEHLPGVSETAILLQQGKDEEAMARIARFSDLVAKFTRLDPDVDTDALLSKLNELVDAFNANDSVLIGDLLEYEIVPAIEEAVAEHDYRKGA
ncbi:MAG: hypothetical protein ACLFM0_04075 [Spirochaetales bacterium]